MSKDQRDPGFVADVMAMSDAEAGEAKELLRRLGLVEGTGDEMTNKPAGDMEQDREKRGD